MINIETLPIFEVGLLCLLFLAPSLYLLLRFKGFPGVDQVLFCLLFAVGFTVLSLIITESRGGLPPGVIYGWPKEFLHVREGMTTFNEWYFVIDLCFYFTLGLGLASLKRVLSESR